MNPNQGREAAYVISKITDKSNVPNPIEYLPMFTCLTPKQGSIEPVLIRDEETLLEEFGNPALNPTLFQDLVAIRDFVRAGRSCWVNRISKGSSDHSYIVSEKDTIRTAIQVFFKYKNYDSLSDEKKAIVNMGYITSGGRVYLVFRDENSVEYRYNSFQYLSDLYAARNEILARTGWEMVRYPNDELIQLSEKHNSNQSLSTSLSNKGEKYLVYRWKNSYTSERECHLIMEGTMYEIDSEGMLIRDSSGNLIQKYSKITPVIKIDDNTYQETTRDDSHAIYIDDYGTEFPRKVGNRLYLTQTRPSSYYIDDDWYKCDSHLDKITAYGGYLVYVDDKVINNKIHKTLINLNNEEVDISYYKIESYYGYLYNRLIEYGIRINIPEGCTPDEMLFTANNLTLSEGDLNPKLFNVSTYIYVQDEPITFTSVKKLIPAEAGWRINYVLYGIDIIDNTYLIEDSITLPDNFTDGQFAEQMSKNPYFTLDVDDPESNNIYKWFSIGGYSNLDYILVTSGKDAVTADDYIASIRKYEDPKYNGCFLGDLSFPCIKYPNLKPMTPDDRKAIQIIMKQIAATRKDITCIFTTPELPLDKACDWVAAKGDYSDYPDYGQITTDVYTEQSFYCEMYYGWMSYKTNLVNGVSYKIDSIAPTVFVIGNIIDSWNAQGISYPVAGDQGGVLNSNLVMPDSMTVINNPAIKSQRDKLVSYRINPIFDTGLRGVQIYGNETLNPQYTDLSAAHIGRMMVQIKSRVDKYTETIKFMLNNKYTWKSWINYVSNNILEPLRTEGGLVWYDVKMGEDTTTREEMSQRKIRGMVSLQFRQDLEIIDLEFVVYSSAINMGV